MSAESPHLGVHEIEPELRTPTPRPVRLRMAVATEVLHRRKVDAGRMLCSMLIFAGLLATLSLPNWLGQVIPARITYQGGITEVPNRRHGSPYMVCTARLHYTQQGKSYEDVVTVPADLSALFPDGSTIPVRVLRPWKARPWTPRDAFWASQFQRSLWTAFSVILVPCGLFLALTSKLTLAWGSKRRAVSEGTPVAGRLLAAQPSWGNGTRQKPSRYGTAIIAFEYVDPTAVNETHPEDSMLRSGRQIPAPLLKLLPPVGQTVTVLLPPGRFTLPCLYALSLYEAVPPFSTPTPSPGTG